MTGPSVIGLDLSLTSTGMAEVKDGVVENYQRVRSSGKKGATVRQTAERLRHIVDSVVTWIEGDDTDLVVIEAPSFGSTTGSQHERGGLWWMVAEELVAEGHTIATVSPQGRAKYATGRGNAKKDEVEAAVRARYELACGWPLGKCDDIADAVVLAAMGSRWIGYPIDEGLSDKQLAAIDGASWPTGVAA